MVRDRRTVAVKPLGLVLTYALFLSLIGSTHIAQQSEPDLQTCFSLEATSIDEKLEKNSISLVASFDEPQLEKIDGHDVIKIKSCGLTSSPGEPIVPTKTIFVLLPPGKDVASVEVEPSSTRPIDQELSLYPGQKPTPIAHEPVPSSMPEFIALNPDIYSSSRPHPSELGKLMFVTSYRGYKIVAVQLFPIQYTPAERRAVFYPEFKVEVKLKAAKGGLALHPTSELEEWVRRHVENPELLSSYNAGEHAEGAEYLIITRPMFLDALQPLVDLKSQRMSVKVMTVDDIISAYPGRDVPEQVRNAIVDHYQNYGTQWVLLAGDADSDDRAGVPQPTYVLDKSWEIPIRYVWDDTYDSPTDYYYAALDGDWDADSDYRYGEPKAKSIVDEVDWFPEVFVGRMPAQDEVTMQAIVNKTVTYELAQWGVDDVILFGANLVSDYLDGKTIKRNIRENFITGDVNVYEYYAQDGTLSYQAFVDAINTYDPRLVNVAAHGDAFGVYYRTRSSVYAKSVLGDPFIDTETPTMITNNGFTMYVMACSTNAFDNNENISLGEALIQDPDGGAVGYIGGTRAESIGWDFLTWGGAGLDAKFFEEIFKNNEVRQGATLYKSKVDYIESGWYHDLEDRADRANLLVAILLGDPELAIGKPFAIEDAHFEPARFRPSAGQTTTLYYTLTKDAAKVVINIYDSAGNLVETLVKGKPRATGLNSEVWDGLVDGTPVAPGKYRAKIVAKSYAGEKARAKAVVRVRE